MSTFDMICDQCGHGFEVFRQGFLQDTDKVCPQCGSHDVRQSLTGFMSYFGSGTTTNCGPRFGKLTSK